MIDLSKFEDVEVVKILTGVKPGQSAMEAGYSVYNCAAPKEPGRYTLWELIDPETWEHEGFIWEKEE